jgi:hypothetical protein
MDWLAELQDLAVAAGMGRFLRLRLISRRVATLMRPGSVGKVPDQCQEIVKYWAGGQMSRIDLRWNNS